MLVFSQALKIEDFRIFPKPWSLTLLGFCLALVLKVQSLSQLAVVATAGPSRHTVAVP